MANLLYFGALREQLNCSSEQLDIARLATLGELVEHLRLREGAWRQALAPSAQWRAAINQHMAALDSPITNSDEIALFPPVTGG